MAGWEMRLQGASKVWYEQKRVTWELWLALSDELDGDFLGLRVEGRSSGQQQVQDDADAPDVAFLVVGLPEQDLRGHVKELRVRLGPAYRPSLFGYRLPLDQDLGTSEIYHLHRALNARALKQDVLRLKIPSRSGA